MVLMRDIVLAVSSVTGVSYEDIMGPRRTRRIFKVRQMALWLVRKQTTNSLPKIGKFFHKDHSTVHFGVNKFDRLMREQPDVSTMIDAVMVEVGRISTRRHEQQEKYAVAPLVTGIDTPEPNDTL